MCLRLRRHQAVKLGLTCGRNHCSKVSQSTSHDLMSLTMKTYFRLSILFAFALTLLSCDDAANEGPQDLGEDLAQDQGLDSPEDGADSADGSDTELSPDASDLIEDSQDADLALDVDELSPDSSELSPDSSPDTPSDTLDAVDGADGADDPRWGSCPDESAYLGESDWPATLQIANETTWCSSFNEVRKLEAEIDFLAKLQFIEGSYPFPAGSGTWPFVLPLCGEFLDPSLGLTHDGEGELTLNVADGNYRATYSQPMSNGTGAPWIMQLTMDGPAPVTEVPIDGQYEFAWEMVTYESVRLCWESCNDNYDKMLQFLPCQFDSIDPQYHDLVFEGGEVTLELRIGGSFASTEPASFVSAEGSLDGVEFSQDDYWQLIYNPEHHHFSRDFIVLFDAPIAGACGLKVENAKPWPDPPPVRVTTVDCELNEIEERVLISDDIRTPW